MDFQNDQPIYIQIGTFIKEQIINGTIQPGEKLPSVREYAVLFEVSPLTIHRTVQYLEAEGIIVTRKEMCIRDRAFPAPRWRPCGPC